MKLIYRNIKNYFSISTRRNVALLYRKTYVHNYIIEKMISIISEVIDQVRMCTVLGFVLLNL